jgi:ketosteroid isomerase-like protein
MSEQDIAIVRDQFEAVNERDFGRAMDHYSDHVVLVVHPGFGLETGTFEGKETVGGWFGQWFEVFEPGFRFEIDEAREIGDVLVLHANLSGLGRTSRAPVRSDLGYLYEVRDGKIVRAEIFESREDALAAASERG